MTWCEGEEDTSRGLLCFLFAELIGGDVRGTQTSMVSCDLSVIDGQLVQCYPASRPVTAGMGSGSRVTPVEKVKENAPGS